MKCPICKKNSFSFIAFWIKGGFGLFHCPECRAVCRAKRAPFLTIMSVALGIVPGIAGVVWKSWGLFFLLVLPVMAVDALMDRIFRRLEPARLLQDAGAGSSAAAPDGRRFLLKLLLFNMISIGVLAYIMFHFRAPANSIMLQPFDKAEVGYMERNIRDIGSAAELKQVALRGLHAAAAAADLSHKSLALLLFFLKLAFFLFLINMIAIVMELNHMRAGSGETP
jgi:hypothetical protein